MILVEQLLNGIVLGHAYALIALGWCILLGVAGLVNFGHGQMYMLAAFVTWWAAVSVGMPYPVSIVLAITVGSMLGIIIQRAMLRATFDKNLVTIMIMTLGFGYLLEGGASLIFGGNAKTIEPEWSMREFDLGDVWLTWLDLTIVVVAIFVFAALKWILQYSNIGRLMRTVSEDPKLSELAGINVKLIYYGVFAFEGAAVALAAGMVAPRTPILTSMGFEEVIITFVVVVLGGVGSVTGSYVAGVALGIFVALFSAFVSAAYATTAAFGVLALVLAVRPGGFGANQ